MSSLALLLATTAMPLSPAPTALELNPHLKAIYARQDGPETGEFFEFTQMFPGTPGPLIVAIDGDGILAGLWDFSHLTVGADNKFIAGGPAVSNRHGDLSSGIGPAIMGTSDFIPNGTVTFKTMGANATYATFLRTLVGLNVDPDGDGSTLLEGPGAPSFNSYGSMALVDDSWPETSQVYDCPPLIGPDGADAPAGAVAGYFPQGPCRDQWLLADGSNVNPGLSDLGSCFTGAHGAILCGESVFGTPFCGGSGSAFTVQTYAWGSPKLSDGNLNLGGSDLQGWHLHLVSTGRSSGTLPAVTEPLCLAAPYFRIPGSIGWQGTRWQVDLGSLSGVVPVVVGQPLCVQTWYRDNGSTPHLAQPIAILLR